MSAPRVGTGEPVAGAAAPLAGRRSRPWFSLGAGILLAALVASVAGWLPLQLMRVGSDSMAPTMPTGSFVVLAHGADDVHRMDVVAVDAGDGAGPLLVKRAVAVGGDDVAIEDGVLVVNGAPVCEPAIDPVLIDAQYFGPLTVPAGQVFLLGDNRASSIDSRSFGPVPVGEVRGVVPWRLWPSPGHVARGADRC